MLRKTSVALTLVMAGAIAGPAAAATVAEGGSVPVADSYYPAPGNARVDVLSYHLNLAWRPGERARVVVDDRNGARADRQ